MTEDEATGGDRARRADLAAMLVPLGRALTAFEVPILRGHGLSMWEYMVLCRLNGRQVRTQAALAASIGADKTRIIAVIDALQDAGLVDRRQDADDRRVYLLSQTAKGRRVQAAAQTDIQRGERRLLARLSPGDRAPFLRALQRLATVSRAEIASLADEA